MHNNQETIFIIYLHIFKLFFQVYHWKENHNKVYCKNFLLFFHQFFIKLMISNDVINFLNFTIQLYLLCSSNFYLIFHYVFNLFHSLKLFNQYVYCFFQLFFQDLNLLSYIIHCLIGLEKWKLNKILYTKTSVSTSFPPLRLTLFKFKISI